MSNVVRRLSSTMFVVFLLVLSSPSYGADAQRGQLLYENHCGNCHDSRAHIRNDRRAKTLSDVRGWVVRWSDTLKLGWGKDERDDVAGYLYGRYYTAQ
jgi:mono/diheme cytochrome c family protein